MAKIEAFKYDRAANKLSFLDQTKLPERQVFVAIENCQEGFQAIKDMLVRGAPCIAAVGCLSIVVHLSKQCSSFESMDDPIRWFDEQANLMIKSRPTAVNLVKSLKTLGSFIHANKWHAENPTDLCRRLAAFCESSIKLGLEANKLLGSFGADEFMNKTNESSVSVLTHCNTGSLATVGHGTALGVIRSLHERGQLMRAYCTETRPYNQGSRLTAWELVQEKIPATLIADNMVAYLMSTHRIDYVVVGADRVVSNGDTANKIGTLQIAVTAKHFGVPFYVAAPSQSIDLSSSNAMDIKIELRPAEELCSFSFGGGNSIRLAPREIYAWNPSFDVTPENMITGIITEYGVCKPTEIRQFLSSDKVAQQRASLGEALF